MDGKRRKYTRRDTLILLGAVPPALLAPGCAVFLLRLLVGRGTAGALTRAARLGGSRAALTYGRGIAAGARIARVSPYARGASVGSQGARNAATQTMPHTQILTRDGRLISETKPSKHGVKGYVDGSEVFYSRRTDYGFEHIGGSQGTRTGKSVNRSNGVIEHRDKEDRVLTFDKIRMAKHVIEHYDKHEQLIGSTDIAVNDGRVSIYPDNETISSIESISEELALDCPDAKAAYDEYIRYGNQCDENGDKRICNRVNFKKSRYDMLAQACKARRR